LLRNVTVAIAVVLVAVMLAPSTCAICQTALNGPQSTWGSDRWSIEEEIGDVQGNQTGTQGVVIVQVSIDNGSGTSVNSPGYTPDNITVVLGVNNTVEWVNKDDMSHTVTAVDGSFDSGEIKANSNFTHTFTQAGTYPYLCVYHHWMHGIVIVLAPGALQTQQPQNANGGPTLGPVVSQVYVIATVGAVALAAVMILWLRTRRTESK